MQVVMGNYISIPTAAVIESLVALLREESDKVLFRSFCHKYEEGGMEGGWKERGEGRMEKERGGEDGKRDGEGRGG